jgi:hypothetical protein
MCHLPFFCSRLKLYVQDIAPPEESSCAPEVGIPRQSNRNGVFGFDELLSLECNPKRLDGLQASALLGNACTEGLLKLKR